MKLVNLKSTLLICIEYHERQGNLTKVAQLKAQLELVKSKNLEDEKTEKLYKD